MQLTVDGAAYSCETGESVLAALTRQGVVIPSSCLAGVCQCCLLKATKGVPPQKAQRGVKDTLKAQQYFLACQCFPESDLSLSLADSEQLFAATTVAASKALSANVLGLRLQRPEGFAYRGGQFLNLRSPGGAVRSYSIASHPEEDAFLELHVARIPEGQVSNWLHDSVAVGSEVEIAGPLGDCFYVPGNLDHTLLLIGSGTGLAPLLGIIRDALYHGHSGPIFLYHGSQFADGLYLQDRLSEIENEASNFHYVRCLDNEEKTRGVRQGRVNELALADHANLEGYRLYVCGNPEMVKQTQRSAYLQGASLSEIYSDAFLPSRSPTTANKSSALSS